MADDRRYGLIGNTGIKVPVRVATTAAITLNGLQTVDGVVLAANDRVLVKNQASGVENGIYLADTGAWMRTADCDGSYDLVKGSLVKVNEGAVTQGFWYCTTSDPIIVGTTSLAFAKATPEQLSSVSIDVFVIAGQSNAVGQGVAGWSPVISSDIALQYYNGALLSGTDPVGNAAAVPTSSAWPSFALNYHNATNRKICFVPAAVNGQPLVGGWDQTTPGSLYANALLWLNDAMTVLRAAGYAPIFKGVLWAGDESDAIAINAATLTKATFKAAFIAFLARWRAASIDSTTFPYMPFYISRVGTDNTASDSGYSQVRAAQEEVVAVDPYSYIVFRGALSFGTLHYQVNGQYNLMGERMAAAIISANEAQSLQARSTQLDILISGDENVSGDSIVGGVITGPDVDPTAVASGLLFLQSNSAFDAGVGAVLAFGGRFLNGANAAFFAAIKGAKENATDSNLAGRLQGYVRVAGGTVAEVFRFSSTKALQLFGYQSTGFLTTDVSGNVLVVAYRQMLSGNSAGSGNANNFAGNSTGYFGPTGANTVNENGIPALASRNGTFKNLRIAGNAPGGAATYTVTLRVNGADTSVVAVITGAGTTGSDLTHTAAITAGQAWDFKIVTSAAAVGTTAGIQWAIEFDL